MALARRTLACAVVLGIFWGLSIITVSTRLYVRKFMVKKVDYDDYFLVLTTVLYIIYGCFSGVAISHDFSSIEIDYGNLLVSLQDVSDGLHYWYLTEVFYILTCLFLRVSVAILLSRIAGTRVQRNFVWGILALMVAVSISFLFIIVFQCRPIEYYWTQWTFAKGKCLSSTVIANTAYAHSGVSFAADWALGLLPIWLLWNVQISVERKIAVATLLGMGLLSGLAAIIRNPFIKRIDETNDFAKDWVGLALTSTIEPGLGIIAASFAAYRPLFMTKRWQSLYSRLLSTTKGSLNRVSGSGSRVAKSTGSGGSWYPWSRKSAATNATTDAPVSKKSTVAGTRNDETKVVAPGNDSGILMTTEVSIEREERVRKEGV
ncbi:integral membrane protein [Phlyctema vagabunda]|uniref:Integral membrane protein n=1 Tax=Phlyctema vagabunda TaxID=108571 RepID=A0ABR4PPK0_9HELO